ncbi:hypothetical protein CPB84DRAFT_1526730 [Gymnopilus junonius]|uniref:Uncharacterized protein n=1 Tax=Gymnopilus junonius TaxID=109634 RepID=A0A9P5N6G1_GYMJU|nr:hypothetical protein CPB84DRAFT_1526730 [Gymnopilus junonius]
MKLQLNILVTLAVFYGSGVAAPVPTNAVADDSISDDVLGALGKLIGEAWAGAVPNNVLQASAQGAGAHLNHNRRDLAEDDDSISDDVLNALGKLIGTAWSNIVPASALQGSAQGAGAHLNHNRRNVAEAYDSISDDVLNTIGKLLGGGFSSLVPHTTLQGAAQGAGAHLNGPYTTRDVDASIPDDVLDTIGKLIGTAWANIVPQSALEGSAQGAGAHLNRNFLLSRDVAGAGLSISNDELQALEKLILGAGPGPEIVPASTFQSSAQGTTSAW